jgi:hypothetical protein
MSFVLKVCWEGSRSRFTGRFISTQANVSRRWRATQMLSWHAVYHQSLYLVKKRCLCVLQPWKIKFYEARLNSGWLYLCTQVSGRSIVGSLPSGPCNSEANHLLRRCIERRTTLCVFAGVWKSHWPLQEGSCVLPLIMQWIQKKVNRNIESAPQVVRGSSNVSGSTWAGWKM